MKLNFRKAAAFVFMTIVLCGCKGKNQGEENSSENLADSNAPLTAKGTVLYQNAPLYQEDANGEMVYFDQIDKGSDVKIYLTGENGKEAESKNVTLKGETAEQKMVHILYFGKDFWIKNAFVAPNTVPAVLKDEATVYSLADKSSATEKKLKKGELVAVADEKKDFESIFCYDGTEFGTEIFVKKSLVSKKADDVLAQQIYSKISLKTNREILEELNESLSTLEISPEIKQEIKIPELNSAENKNNFGEE
ncbi:hypothetical protein [Treponema zioleckii]|uniref:hypothetical protein n=1 Tax=Treponema zioleckii TaxID=331680 RepID=UPI00168B7059|nr:hypothetical protein [Treponema zioleckii]